MKNHIDAMFEQAKIIDNVVDSLFSLNLAFRRTGNDVMGSELHNLAARLDKSAKTIRSAAGELASEAFESAGQASANMINAALAMGRLNNDN